MAESTWRDLMDVRTALRRYVVEVLGRMPRPAEQGRILRVGPDPVRILLIGAGAAAGYGVATRAHALDGAIADALHGALGRGVVVENRSVRNVRISDVVSSLGAAGAHTFDVVVWAPTYLEVAERVRMASWRRELTTLVTDLHAGSSVDVVLLLLPRTTGGSPVAALGRRWLPRINAVIEQVAASTPRTVAVAVEPAEMAAAGEVVLDQEYYARCAARLLPALVGAVLRGRAAS